MHDSDGNMHAAGLYDCEVTILMRVTTMSDAIEAVEAKAKRRPPAAGNGRPKGALNVFNRDIKEMILGALSDVGGRAYLARQAEKNPNAFMGLIGRVLPLSIAGHDGGEFVIRLKPIDLSDPLSGPPDASSTLKTIEGRVFEAVEVANEVNDLADVHGQDQFDPPDGGNVRHTDE
jgi:hypothetical protein